jgi:seryl-tRNA synthetase
MLTLKLLRDDPEFVIKKLAVKNFDAKEIVNAVLELDTRRRAIQTENDALLAEQKQKAALIGGFMKEGKKAEAEEAKKEVAALKTKSTDLQAQAEQIEKDLMAKIVLLPNIPCDLVIPGKGSEDNQVVKMGGKMPELGPDALPHWELAKEI